MQQHIAHIALIVNDYDESIKFYTEKLKFNLIEDTKLSETKRWVLIAPPGNSTFSLLLAKAATEEQSSRVGNQLCRIHSARKGRIGSRQLYFTRMS